MEENMDNFVERKPSVSFSDLVEKDSKNPESTVDLTQHLIPPMTAGGHQNYPQKNINEMRPPSPTITTLVPHSRNFFNANGGSSSRLNNITNNNELVPLHSARRPSALLQEILTTRRPSAIITALTRPQNPSRQRPPMGSLREVNIGSSLSFNDFIQNGPPNNLALESKRKNRRIGDDALSTALSALYAKLVVIMGIAMPVTEILSNKIPVHIYQGFYVYLYLGSLAFVFFVYSAHCRTRAVFSMIKRYHEKNDSYHEKKRVEHFGSFYLRVGAIAFGIGNMVYSGLEIGRYIELRGTEGCANFFLVLTPAARMALSIVQMQFIFLNTTELEMAKHKVIARFGLMHMVATNLCEWLYVLVEETKHEIYHLAHPDHHESTTEKITQVFTTTTEMPLNETTQFFNMTTEGNVLHNMTKRSIMHTDCHRTNIMGHLVQNASPFLFPCTIEYSLICAVILYEMWKKVRSLPDIERSRRNSQKIQLATKSAHHFSIDCARSHRGMFAGIIIVVFTIISLIMYFVLYDHKGYEQFAIAEVTITEILMYVVCLGAVIAAMIKMRDLKFHKKGNDHHSSSVSLDCTLLVLAQTGVYVYAMFSIMGCFFAMQDNISGGQDGLIAEILSLIQTSIQTLFILNASWRRCKGSQQNRKKPGREIVTFLLVANMSMWFINTLIKGRAGFRPTHLEFFGKWAWTIITHVSMPLAIFYRFHSTICLFEIWKTAYKNKNDHH